MRAVLEGTTLHVSAAAKKIKVPRKTLDDRVKGRVHICSTWPSVVFRLPFKWLEPLREQCLFDLAHRVASTRKLGLQNIGGKISHRVSYRMANEMTQSYSTAVES